jgi:hypothetical protein
MNKSQRYRCAQYFLEFSDQTSKNFSFGPTGPYYSNREIADAIIEGTQFGLNMCAMFDRYAARHNQTIQETLDKLFAAIKQRPTIQPHVLWTYLPP